MGNLIDSNFSILNQRLARHYGIEGVVGQKMRKVSFSSEVPRGGSVDDGKRIKGDHRWICDFANFARRVDFEEHCRYAPFATT